MKALKDAHRTHRIMASKALSNQVAAKWQDSFNRLNRVAPGISGLMEFSKVRRPFVTRWMGFLCSTWRHRALFLFFSGLGNRRRISPAAGARGAFERL